MHLARATLWLSLVAMAALPAQAEEAARTGNAAIHYWCAAAEMKRPTNDQEEKVLDYIKKWSRMPPKAFIERGDAVRFLKEDLEAGGAMDMLHVGAECPQCDFDTTDPVMGGQQLRHVALLLELAHRAWAAAALLEGQGDSLRAAQVQADVIQFSVHLSQCPSYADYGSAMLSDSLMHMEEFVSRKPGPEALHALMDRLSRIPPNPLSFSRWLNDTAEYGPAVMFKDLRLTDKDLDEKISLIEKNAERFAIASPHFKTIVQMLRSKKPRDRAGLLDGWRKQVEDELRALAKAGDGPLTESEPRVQAWQQRIQRLAKPAEGQSPAENPLLLEWPDLVMSHYWVFASTNARQGMIRIFCAAMLCEAETGQYPASLEALARYFPAGLPKDPFTGKDFLYALEEGLPCVTAQPSAWSRAEAPDSSDWGMGMARILSRLAERYRKRLQSPASDAHN